MQITRRKLAAALAAPAAAGLALASPQVQPPPADDLAAARARLRDRTGALARFELPMSTEPAFQFKA